MALEIGYSEHTALVRERHGDLYKVSLLPVKAEPTFHITDPLAKVWRKVKGFRRGSDNTKEYQPQEAVLLLTPESIEFYTVYEGSDVSVADTDGTDEASVQGRGGGISGKVGRAVGYGVEKGAHVLEKGVQLVGNHLMRDKSEHGGPTPSEASSSRLPELPSAVGDPDAHAFSIGIAMSQARLPSCFLYRYRNVTGALGIQSLDGVVV